MKSALMILLILFLSAFPGYALSETVDDLAGNLHSYDRNVQQSAIEKLGKIREEKAVSALFQLIYRKGEDWKLKVRAIRLLGDIPDPEVTDRLVTIFNDPFLNDECPAMKWNAAVALGKGFNKGSRAVDALISALDYNNLLIREAAIQSLGKIGDPAAVPHLIPELTDKNFAIKYSAIKALESIHDLAAIPSMKKFADTDNDTFLRHEAVQAIEALSGRIETRR
jgi:HEAT repeat protein